MHGKLNFKVCLGMAILLCILLVAVFARNLAQAMMMLFLILMPMMFLSGAFTPPESMSPWMRYASLVSPMRYFMDFGYQVLFKGKGIFCRRLRNKRIEAF